MCVTGCHPKRAGQEFFSELKDSPLNIKELAKKHRVDIKVIELPIKSIIKNGKLDEKIFSNWVRGFVRKINIDNNKLVYQGSFLVAEGRTIENENLFLPLSSRISDTLNDLIKIDCGCRLILRIIPKKRYNKNLGKPKMIFIFSKRDNIKSYLFGDFKFTWSHWFVNKFPSDFSGIDKSIEVIDMKSIKEAKRFAKSFGKSNVIGKEKTPCIFCSEKIYKYVRELIGEKFGYDMVVRAV